MYDQSVDEKAQIPKFFIKKREIGGVKISAIVRCVTFERPQSPMANTIYNSYKPKNSP